MRKKGTSFRKPAAAMRWDCRIPLLVSVGLHPLHAYVLRHSNEIDSHGIPFVYRASSTAPPVIVCLPPSSAATWWSFVLARGVDKRIAEQGEAKAPPQFHLPYRTSTDEWDHVAARSQWDVPAYMVVDPPHTRLLAAFLHQTRLSSTTRHFQPSVAGFRTFVEAVIESNANELHKPQHLHCNLKSGMRGRYRYLRMDQLDEWYPSAVFEPKTAPARVGRTSWAGTLQPGTAKSSASCP